MVAAGFVSRCLNGQLPYVLFYNNEARKLFLFLEQGTVRKEGSGFFNDALNTFYLRLYGIGNIVKDHSDSERGNESITFLLPNISSLI